MLKTLLPTELNLSLALNLLIFVTMSFLPQLYFKAIGLGPHAFNNFLLGHLGHFLLCIYYLRYFVSDLLKVLEVEIEFYSSQYPSS